MSDQDAVKELGELLKKATPEPWQVHEERQYGRQKVYVSHDGERGRHFIALVIGTGSTQELRPQNAALISSARNHLPALLSALDSHRARVAVLEEALRKNVIFRSSDKPTYGVCNNCESEWHDGVETHFSHCILAALTSDRD